MGQVFPLDRHLQDIRKGGWQAFWRKVARIPTRLWIAAGTVAVLPVVMIFRLLRPWLFIRFGFFTVDRFGHFAFDVEFFLSRRTLQSENQSVIDIFFFKGVPANTQMARMCRRAVVVNPLVRYLYLANQLLPRGTVHQILPARHTTASRDKAGILHKAPTQLVFTADENRQGIEYLRKIGCIEKSKFICLVVRDSVYLEQTQVGRDWSYHNFRDTHVEDYEEVVLTLAHKGYWVLRMGKVVHRPLLVEHSRIIDYATAGDRCDLLDVWLMANCYFAVSTGLGLDSIADIFRRPIVFVNYLPILDLEAWGPYITVPKHLSWASNNKPLTLQEQLKHTSLNGHYYEEKGIQVCDLHPSEIIETVLEMESRLSGSWVETGEDVELHEKFWSEFRAWPNFSKYHGWIHPEARLGTHYLRRSKNWLFNG